MYRSQHLDVAIHQSRHRVLCGLICHSPEGLSLIDRARQLGFPVDWQDGRVYPNRPGYSDYGATFLLAKDVVRAEAAQHYRMQGHQPDYSALDALSSRQAQHEATNIFNSLRAQGIELSGYAQGRYFTCQQTMPNSGPNSGPNSAPSTTPWMRQRYPAPAPALLPPRSKRH